MIHVFESLAPTNFFSPFYKYFMYENMSDIDIKKLKNHILNIEKETPDINPINILNAAILFL